MENRRRLRAAVIMDEFTYQCYAPECDILQVTPDNFKEEIDGFHPDLLMIESVWRGKDNLWRFRLHDDTEALEALTGYCRGRGIPVVFWSKEDPVHFGVFIRAAALADHVFTTDADCVELYKAHLGHDRVYYLPFAAQPRLHNPIEEYERKDKFCFAGSFYVKYKERSNTFLKLAPLFQERGLDIYDRNFNKGKAGGGDQSTAVASPAAENYYFPPGLRECVLGVLPYNEISRAYKGYRYGVNMTSMVQSGYMFARRAFELLACNTVTVSNYSRGLSLFFGDLLIAADDREEMRKRLERFCGTEEDYRKYRLAGLRHVLASHLYEDRLDRIARKALGISIRKPLPEILVVCFEEDSRVRAMFEAQTYEKKRLLMGDTETALGSVPFDFVTVFSPKDSYGKNYLMDLALATRFADDEVIGKTAYYSAAEQPRREKTYIRVTEPVQLTRQMAARALIDESSGAARLREFHPEARILSLDEFNYRENAESCGAAEDMECGTGVPLEEIYARTDRIQPVSLRRAAPFDLAELFEEVRIGDGDLVEKSYEGGALVLERGADDDRIVWLRTRKNYRLADFTTGSRIGFFTQVGEKSGNVRCQIEYYDEAGVKLDFLNFALDGFALLRISDRAKTFKLIFRMRGKARVALTGMNAVSPDSLLPAPFPMGDSLLITERYPSYERPDELPALHRFAKERGLEVLLAERSPRYLPYSEYEGVQIVASQYGAIREYLAARPFKRIYVYELSDAARACLDQYPGEIVPVTI